MEKKEYKFEDFKYYLLIQDSLADNFSVQENFDDYNYADKSMITMLANAKMFSSSISLWRNVKLDKSEKKYIYSQRGGSNFGMDAVILQEISEKQAQDIFSQSIDRRTEYEKTAHFNLKKELADSFPFGEKSLFYEESDCRRKEVFKKKYSKPNVLVMIPKQEIFSDPFRSSFFEEVGNILSLLGLKGGSYDINYDSILASFGNPSDDNFIFIYTKPLGSSYDASGENIYLPEIVLLFLNALGQRKRIDYRQKQVDDSLAWLDKRLEKVPNNFLEYETVYGEIVKKKSEIKKLKYILHSEAGMSGGIIEKYEKRSNLFCGLTHKNVIQAVESQKYYPSLGPNFSRLGEDLKKRLVELEESIKLLDAKIDDYENFSSDIYNLFSLRSNFKLQKNIFILTVFSAIAAILSLISLFENEFAASIFRRIF